MTKEELNTMETLNKKFQKECSHVASYLTELDSDFNHAEHAWALDCGTAKNYGDIYSRGCYMETVNPEFDVDLLTYTDEQLQEYVKKKQQEKNEEEKREKEMQEKRQREKELTMYKHLKEKLGL